MVSYGSFSEGSDKDKDRDNARSCAVQQAGQGKPAIPAGPIFLENPDGTITEAVPSNYTDPKRPGSRRSDGQRQAFMGEDSDGSSGNLSEGAAANMYQEVDFLYSRHQGILMLLLSVQFLLEVLYDVVYVLRMKDGSSVVEFMAMYSWRVNPKAAEALFWSIFSIQVGYTALYYIIALLALWTKRPKQYRLFANYGIAGIVGLVLLAYVDKFNLIIFFLHLLIYIYARFLQGLTASLLLLPPAPQAQPPQIA